MNEYNFRHSEPVTESANKQTSDSDATDGNDTPAASAADEEKKKKKKRTNPKSLIDELNDNGRSHGYDASQIYINHYRNGNQEDLDECPILDAIDKRCESVDLLGGGGNRHVYEHDALLPACTMHQFCYLCVSHLHFCIHL